MPVRKHGSAAEAAAAMGSLPKTFHERYDRFYLLIGHCIAGWARLDEQLFQVFCECIGPYEQAAIVYYRSPGIDIRLNLVDELVRSVLPKRDRKSGGHDHQYVKEWKNIFGEIRSYLTVRRRVAHQPVQIIQNLLLALTRPDLIEGSILHIQANTHELIREKEADIKPIVFSDLEKHITNVDESTNQLAVFRETLRAHVLRSRE